MRQSFKDSLQCQSDRVAIKLDRNIYNTCDNISYVTRFRIFIYFVAQSAILGDSNGKYTHVLTKQVIRERLFNLKGGLWFFFLKKYSDSQCCWKKYSDFGNYPINTVIIYLYYGFLSVQSFFTEIVPHGQGFQYISSLPVLHY
jgi:hypothetical protein